MQSMFFKEKCNVWPGAETVWKEPTNRHQHCISRDDIHRINPCYRDLDIFMSLFVTNETVDKDVLEWPTTSEFPRIEDQTRHPEEDGVVPCYQGWSWEVTFWSLLSQHPASPWLRMARRAELELGHSRRSSWVHPLSPSGASFSDVHFTSALQNWRCPHARDYSVSFPSIGGRYHWKRGG